MALRCLTIAQNGSRHVIAMLRKEMVPKGFLPGKCHVAPRNEAGMLAGIVVDVLVASQAGSPEG